MEDSKRGSKGTTRTQRAGQHCTTLNRVEVGLFFVPASRNADMTLHLAAEEQLSKRFFLIGSHNTIGSGHVTSQTCIILGQRILTLGMSVLAEVSQSARMEFRSPLLERTMPVNI